LKCCAFDIDAARLPFSPLEIGLPVDQFLG
jgi:hypothetical protein